MLLQFTFFTDVQLVTEVDIKETLDIYPVLKVREPNYN